MADTSVPPPQFGDNGFVAPPESAILAGVFADINNAFGGNLNPGLSTPQGQLASTEAAIIGDSNATFLWFISGVDPATSSGRMQDAIGRIYFIERNPALPTAVTVTVTGLPNVVIPNGTLAADTEGNSYLANGDITIGPSGTGTGQFENIATGPIPCSAGTLIKITQAIFGWDTITNPDDGALGNDVESRADFEQRRAAATAVNSIGSLPSVLGAVLTVSGVLDAFVYDNYTGGPLIVGGVLIQPRSLYVCVAGGSDTSVAFAIWTRKAPGCGYTGNTTVVVYDPSPSYGTLGPSYPVTFDRPTSVPFYVLVSITNAPTVPSTALTQVQAVVINAFAGTDGGPRARIGSLVYASRYYGPVMALGAWAHNIISIKVGTTITASIVGYISGSTMTVTSVASGNLRRGDLLLGGSGLASPTTITGLISGTGLTGTYLVSGSQTLAPGTLSAVNMFDDVQMNLDQLPTVSDGTIFLALD
jgi:hypothetical protein